jgi:uncharacterized repeat protein (TIGR02543 family)
MKKIIMIITTVMLLWNTGIAQTKYTVIFEIDDNFKTDTVQVDSGKVVTKLPSPVKEGFIFQGWYDKTGSEWNIESPITKDSVITAKWVSLKEIIKPVEKKVNLLLYILVALAILLAGLVIYILLVLDNKKRFKDNVLNLLVTEKGTRMGDFMDKIVKSIKSTMPVDSSQSHRIKDADIDDIVKTVLDKLKDKQKKDCIESEEQQTISHPPVSAPSTSPSQVQTHSLYANAIIDDEFDKVKEKPDDDTIFELVLSNPNETRATVKIYKEAYPVVIERSEFLDGCEKQILVGGNTVTMMREGVAQKDGNSGKWIIKTKPEVKIS